MLGENVAKEIQKIQLSDNTVSRRINAMAVDILEQLRDKLLESKLFSIHLNESTDIKGKCQLQANVNLLEVIPCRKVFFFAENFQLVNWSSNIQYNSKIFGRRNDVVEELCKRLH